MWLNDIPPTAAFEHIATGFPIPCLTCTFLPCINLLVGLQNTAKQMPKRMKQTTQKVQIEETKTKLKGLVISE